MERLKRKRWLFVGKAILALLPLCDGQLAGDQVTLTETKDRVTVSIGGQRFTEYIFQGHAKPILYPIIGPHGIEMTRNYPMKEGVDNEAHDHPHQKSLWYTHGDVNGIDFWSEYARQGENNPFGRIVQTAMTIQGNTICSEDQWIGPNGQIICTDLREVRFGQFAAGRYIDFQITLQATHGDVIFGDTKEGSMGIRTHPLLRLEKDERRGTHTVAGQAINSEGVEGKAIWGQRAKWVDYWAPINGQTVGIAIFDHPSNPRHPTWWHARTYGLVAANPFGIHDFEKQGVGAGEMRIESGKRVTFRYRFLFHQGDYQEAKVAGQYARFADGADP